MGLDMFLQKAKKIGEITAIQIANIDSYFSYLERPDEYKGCSMEKWCGVKFKDVNLALVKEYKNEYKQRYACWDTNKEYGWKSIIDTIASWRKANHIHRWFVENIQNSNDDCGIYEVSKEKLEELLDICKIVLNGSQFSESDGCIEGPSIAEKLLPTTSGFFFGGTEYDQWYIEDIKYTIKIIEEVLENTDFNNEIIMYSSSW